MSKKTHMTQSTSENKINVVFAINERFLEPFSVAFRSLAETNKHNELQVFIIYDFLAEANLTKLQKLISSYGINLKFLKVDGGQVSGLRTGQHFDRANYYRLFIPDLIQEDRVLYLDSDILVKGDLSELYSVDLEDNYIAAVPELISGWHPDLPLAKKGSYFNSGVMLINMELWKKDNIASKVIEFVESNPKLIRFVDQCGLNACLKGKWTQLPLKTNAQSMVFEEMFKMPEVFSKQEIKEAHDYPVIVHFTGSNKPWHMGNKHPYRWQYWQNLYHTPFRRYIPEDFSFINTLKFLSPKKLKMKLRKIKLATKHKMSTR